MPVRSQTYPAFSLLTGHRILSTQGAPFLPKRTPVQALLIIHHSVFESQRMQIRRIDRTAVYIQILQRIGLQSKNGFIPVALYVIHIKRLVEHKTSMPFLQDEYSEIRGLTHYINAHENQGYRIIIQVHLIKDVFPGP